MKINFAKNIQQRIGNMYLGKRINFDLITALILSYHVRHHVHNDTSAGTAWFLFPDHAPYNFKPSHAWKAGWDLEWLQILTDGLSIKDALIVFHL
jgi:hypothetical protein